MPFDSSSRSKNATVQTRNPHGQFAPTNSEIKSSIKSSGAGQIIGGLLKTEQIKDKDDHLLYVGVKNPFSKLINLLRDIKNNQETKVNMKFTIPLIVLPTLILLIAYIFFGKGSGGICETSYSTITGTLKNLNVIKKDEGNFFTHLVSFIPYFKDRSYEDTQTVLLGNDSFATTVVNKTGLSLLPYENQKIYLSGNYSSCKKEIELIDLQNISQY